MKTAAYFRNDVLAKRPYLSEAICATAIANRISEKVQPDGRFQFWGEVTLPGYGVRIIRVVTLEDKETIHTAFIDSGYGRRSAS